MIEPASLLLGLDDTDMLHEGGTGRLSRELARLLVDAMGAELLGVSRHPLLQDPRVPCTRKNQTSCIALRLRDEAIGPLGAWLRAEVRRRAVPGSDPGICVATRRQVTPAIVGWGERVKRDLVGQAEALALAAREGLLLEPLGETGGGVIGALAAVGLRAAGNDGRLTMLGRIRELDGAQPVAAILSAGPIARVCDAAGMLLPPEAMVETAGKVRPWLRGGEPVLVVERAGDGMWRPVHRGS